MPRGKVIAFAALMVAACAQSTIVLDPANNKAATASTAATQGTVTVNVNIPTHTTREFSILLYQNGVLMAGLPRGNAAAVTDGSGVASVQLILPDTNNCLNGATATLANGTYQVYFAIRAIADATVSTVNAGAVCGANGHLQYSNIDTSFRHHRGTITVNGDTTYSITSTNTSLGMVHKFTLAVGNGVGFASRNYRCYLTDTAVTSITATTQPLALYVDDGTLDGNGDGCTTGNGVSTTLVTGICTPSGGAQSYLPAVGSYAYFCYIDSNNNGNFLESGTDKLASGTLTVTGANTTYLTNGSFSAVP